MEVYDLIALPREEVVSAIQDTLRERRRLVGEREYRRKDGSLVDVVGAIRMEALCTELEEMGRSEDLAAAPVRISRLEEFGRVRVVFEEELSKKG